MADSLSESASESSTPEDPNCGPATIVAVRDYGATPGSARVYLERTGRLRQVQLPAAMLEPHQLRIHSTPLETLPASFLAAESEHDGLTEEWPPAPEWEVEDEPAGP